MPGANKAADETGKVRAAAERQTLRYPLAQSVKKAAPASNPRQGSKRPPSMTRIRKE